MNAIRHRIARLEATSGKHDRVWGVLLLDMDEVVVLSMRSAAEHERMPRSVFDVRYPHGAIVDCLGAAWMWEAL